MSIQENQPKALRLAEKLYADVDSVGVARAVSALKAAVELRAQHELIQKLTAALVNANALAPCPMYSEALGAAEAHK